MDGPFRRPTMILSHLLVAVIVVVGVAAALEEPLGIVDQVLGGK